jgi:peptidoglycan/LPS O-acetylase OafA/YrhL
MKHIEELDSLRGIACLLVLFDHLYSILFLQVEGHKIFRGGFIGVDLFFILSGFLISSLLFAELRKNSTINLYKFYSRRALRLLPPVLIVIPLVILPIIIYIDGFKIMLINYFYLVTYTTIFPKFLEVLNYFPQPYWFPHAWSLSIEEIFYLFFPFLLMKVRDRNKILIFICILFVINIILLPYVLKIFQGGAYHNPLWHFSQTGLGVALAIFLNKDEEGKMFFENNFFKKIKNYYIKKFPMFFNISFSYIFAMFIFASPGTETPWFFNWGAPLLSFSVCTIIYGVVSRLRSPAFLKNTQLRFIGRISYGLYLFHLPLYRFVEHFVVKKLGFVYHVGLLGWISVDIIILVLTFILSFLSWKLIEEKTISLKKKYFTV